MTITIVFVFHCYNRTLETWKFIKERSLLLLMVLGVGMFKIIVAASTLCYFVSWWEVEGQAGSGGNEEKNKVAWMLRSNLL
jgi:hypothetical protein